MQTQLVSISKVKPNQDNPRIIKDYKFKKLVQSIKDFPQMLELRPIVVNEENIVLGGNMRLKACQEAGLKEVHIIQAKDLTEAQQREFIIKDNVGFGEWDWDLLANEWDTEQLEEWGLDGFPFEEEDLLDDNPYTSKIDSPEYEPTGEKPQIKDLYNDEKTKELIKDIENTSISKNDKEFLKKAAQRHIVFDYSKIAEYYCHADKEVQSLMEDNALIIIDFKKAIQQGYVQLNEDITNQYLNEYGDE